MAVLKYVLVAYDISDDKTRTKVFRKLQYFGLIHVQYSVFKGYIDEKDLRELIHTLKKIGISHQDSIEIVQLGRNREGCVVIGRDIEFKEHVII